MKCKKLSSRLKARARIVEYREAVLSLLGNKCAGCGFSDKRALQIDHVNGGGSKQGRELKMHRGVKFYKLVLSNKNEDYQLLCANCNWIKRIEKNELPKRIN
jgi:RNase P subunit RPR2